MQEPTTSLFDFEPVATASVRRAWRSGFITSFIVCCGCAFLLAGGCNTVEGAGEDIQEAGEAIEDAGDED